MYVQREDQVKMETEIGVRQAQAMEHLKPPEAGTGNEQHLSQSPQRNHGPADTLTLNF